MTDLEIKGHDVLIAAEDLPPNMRDDLIACGGPGEALPAVEYFIDTYTIEHDPLAPYLKGYGAWNDEDLADEAENLRRAVWLIGCDLYERGEAYLSKS